VTFITGFNCANGLVICTDSLEADGLTKWSVDKIRVLGTTDWQVAIAGAGGGGIINKFCDDVSTAIPRELYKRGVIESVIEDTLSHFRSRYQAEEERFEVIVGIYCNRTIDRHLYRSGNGHLSPVADHVHIGSGHSLWRFLIGNLYVHGNSVEDNGRLAVFIMNQAIEHVDGVDEPIQLATYAFGDQWWTIRKGAQIWALSPAIYSYDVKTALGDFWKQENPPSLMDQLKKYRVVRTPGDELTFLEGVKVEELATGASLNRVSSSLYGNRDRLHKRAMLEKERDQAAATKNK
jgi:20S proteasome alpha/beta subunit